LAGIDMYGNSIPAGKVGGDLFEYINFQQRYNIGVRVARAVRLSTDYLEPLPEGRNPRNSVDTFYTFDARGYTDYPFYEQRSKSLASTL
jgi:hypothetical protein